MAILPHVPRFADGKHQKTKTFEGLMNRTPINWEVEMDIY
jgi:hypothetical protein